MASDFDTSQFDAENSDELLAKGVRLIKFRTEARLEKAKAAVNPHALPDKKVLKEVNQDEHVAAVIVTLTKYWQEEAFRLGKAAAYRDVLNDIKDLSI